MTFNDTLFRCSSLGKLMTEPRSKSETLSETTKTHLIEVYVKEIYGREKDVVTKYMEKGLACEEDSITLLSRVKKMFYTKNESRIHNDFIIGTPDLYEGESITEATHIVDIKTSWDIFTFFKNHTQPVNKDYWWQLQGYMALTGADTASLIYCLVDTPEMLINDEKRRLLYKMNVATEENKEYIQACEDLDKSMKFSDIPMHERIIEFFIERDDAAINRMYERAEACRAYLNEFVNKINPSTLKAA